MIARGYKGDEIRGLFHKAIACAKTYNGPTVDDDTDHNNIILHLPFHPNDPASFPIGLAYTRSETTMENAPGTHEKPNNKRKLQHQMDDYRIQTPHEPR